MATIGPGPAASAIRPAMAPASRSQAVPSFSSTSTASRPSPGENARTRREAPATSARIPESCADGPRASPGAKEPASRTSTEQANPSGENPNSSRKPADVSVSVAPVTRSRSVRAFSRVDAISAWCPSARVSCRERLCESSRALNLSSRPSISRDVTGLSTYSKTLFLMAFCAYSNSSYPERITTTVSGKCSAA